MMVVICKIVSLDINYGRFVCRRGCAVAGVQEDFLFDSCLESGFDTFLLLGLVGIMRIWFACLKDHVFSFVLGRGVCLDCCVMDDCGISLFRSDVFLGTEQDREGKSRCPRILAATLCYHQRHRV
jgi:hypothetical protein